jgi:hypothetical protein
LGLRRFSLAVTQFSAGAAVLGKLMHLQLLQIQSLSKASAAV